MSIEKLSTNASLKDVMDKFEEITLLDFASIDIVAASQLPSNVKNGQIVVIGSNINNIYIANETRVNLEENDVIINLCEGGESFSISVGNKHLKIDIFGAKQYTNSQFIGVDSFIGVDNVWVPMNDFYFFKQGTGSNYANLFKLGKSNHVNGVVSLDDEKIILKHSFNVNATHTAYATYKNVIDFSSYNTLYLDSSLTTNSTDCYLYILDEEEKTIHTETFSSSFSRRVKSIDISSLNGYYKIKLYIKGYSNGATTINITFNIFNLYLSRK